MITNKKRAKKTNITIIQILGLPEETSLAEFGLFAMISCLISSDTWNLRGIIREKFTSE
jgi:hypothetical protein